MCCPHVIAYTIRGSAAEWQASFGRMTLLPAMSRNFFPVSKQLGFDSRSILHRRNKMRMAKKSNMLRN